MTDDVIDAEFQEDVKQDLSYGCLIQCTDKLKAPKLKEAFQTQLPLGINVDFEIERNRLIVHSDKDYQRDSIMRIAKGFGLDARPISNTV